MQEGFERRLGPIVLPLSMSQYYAAFLADDAPFGLDVYLKQT
jgi:hypothetical protein